MYINLKRNHDSSKKGYIWELSRSAYDVLIQAALKKENKTLNESDIYDLCSHFVPITRNIFDKGYRFTEKKFVIINQPVDEPASAISKFRKLKSLKAVKTKNDFYMLFGEIDSEDLVQSPIIKSLIVRYNLVKYWLPETETASIEPLILDPGSIYCLTSGSFLSEPQIGVVYSGSEQTGSYIYFYGMNPRIDDEVARGYFDIKFTSNNWKSKNIIKDSDTISKIELFVRLNNILGDNIRELVVYTMDADIDFPIVENIKISMDYFKSATDGYEQLKELLDEIYKYNCNALLENTQLTIKDYGYTKLSVEQAMNPDNELRKIKDYLKNIKEIKVQPLNHNELFTKLTGLDRRGDEQE